MSSLNLETLRRVAPALARIDVDGRPVQLTVRARAGQSHVTLSLHDVPYAAHVDIPTAQPNDADFVRHTSTGEFHGAVRELAPRLRDAKGEVVLGTPNRGDLSLTTESGAVATCPAFMDAVAGGELPDPTPTIVTDVGLGDLSRVRIDLGGLTAAHIPDADKDMAAHEYIAVGASQGCLSFQATNRWVAVRRRIVTEAPLTATPSVALLPVVVLHVAEALYAAAGAEGDVHLEAGGGLLVLSGRGYAVSFYSQLHDAYPNLDSIFIASHTNPRFVGSGASLSPAERKTVKTPTPEDTDDAYGIPAVIVEDGHARIAAQGQTFDFATAVLGPTPDDTIVAPVIGEDLVGALAACRGDALVYIGSKTVCLSAADNTTATHASILIVVPEKHW